MSSDKPQASEVLCYSCQKSGGTLRKLELYVHDGACSGFVQQGLIQLQQAIGANLARLSGAAGASGVRAAAVGGVPPDKIPIPGGKS